MKLDKHISLDRLIAEVNNVNIDQEVLVFHTDQPFTGVSMPLRFEGLLIALVSSGHGRVGIDLRDYELERNSLLVLHPRNYLYFAEGEGITIDVLACSSGVVENVLPKLTDLMPLLMHHRSEPVELLDDKDADMLRDYYEFLKQKMSEPRTPFSRQKMMCILQSALFEMMEIHCRRERIDAYQKTRKEEIMAKFILMVSESFRTSRQVSYYAEQLCVSSKHLSAVVKEISGRTAGEWIENFVTVEAKVLLRSTDLTIQEIAARLHFSNQSFFGKYFKHQTGLSPSEYRKREK